ncbi:MAG: HAMP domain-containing histidine kinase [Lachnospira sp.]|nr:HAMP domain-containing histidine kinase [Lachnospira sp.]
MKVLRNKEVFRTLILYILVSVAATVIAWRAGEDNGLLMLLICATFIIIYLVSTSLRYRQIARLSWDVDKILHGDNHIDLDKCSEGELAILQSEIYKMTVRLREQQQKLLDDKIYLADSIADISHQIRTPLTSINLVVQMLTKDDLTEERRCQLFRELKELLSRIDHLITVLLKISKLDAGTVEFKRENVPMADLVRIATEPLLIPIELRNQELTVNARGEFIGDVAWTGEAVGNIVKNCMEHTPNGGKLMINATTTPLYTEIVIEDNGCGIDKEDLPHIFERFYKGKNSTDKSFGIGLALARMIITGQNGTVKAENVMEQGIVSGARFVVRFYKGTV